MDARYRDCPENRESPDDDINGDVSMRSIHVSRLGFSLAAVVTIGACGDRNAPKTPLQGSTTATVGSSAAETRIGITGAAKTALDSGNAFFRAKAYDRALAQYRRSALLAPTELAPLFGILMVTDVTKNARLADSTLARMRELNPAAADSSVARSHAEIVGVHPRTGKPAAVPPTKKQETGTESTSF
jgi:hypothetical protein